LAIDHHFAARGEADDDVVEIGTLERLAAAVARPAVELAAAVARGLAHKAEEGRSARADDPAEDADLVAYDFACRGQVRIVASGESAVHRPCKLVSDGLGAVASRQKHVGAGAGTGKREREYLVADLPSRALGNLRGGNDLDHLARARRRGG